MNKSKERAVEVFVNEEINRREDEPQEEWLQRYIDKKTEFSLLVVKPVWCCPLCRKTRYMWHLAISQSNDVDYNNYCSSCDSLFIIDETVPKRLEIND